MSANIKKAAAYYQFDSDVTVVYIPDVIDIRNIERFGADLDNTSRVRFDFDTISTHSNFLSLLKMLPVENVNIEAVSSELWNCKKTTSWTLSIDLHPNQFIRFFVEVFGTDHQAGGQRLVISVESPKKSNSDVQNTSDHARSFANVLRSCREIYLETNDHGKSNACEAVGEYAFATADRFKAIIERLTESDSIPFDGENIPVTIIENPAVLPIITHVMEERKLQDRRWGRVDGSGAHEARTWLTIALKKLGDVAQCTYRYQRPAMRSEIVQAIAVLFAWLEQEAVENNPNTFNLDDIDSRTKQ